MEADKSKTCRVETGRKADVVVQVWGPSAAEFHLAQESPTWFSSDLQLIDEDHSHYGVYPVLLKDHQF